MESSTISILVNGSLTNEFQPKSGLRQGDPMTQFLFLIIAEGLAGLVRQTTKKQMCRGVRVRSKGTMINLLQFVHDTLFVCEAHVANIKIIKTILRCFEMLSGLRLTSTIL